MTETYVHPDYLPWLLAHDFNFLPDVDAMHEDWDLGGDDYMVLLASYTVTSNILFTYDNEKGDFSP